MIHTLNVPKQSCSKELDGLYFSLVSFTYILLGFISDFQIHKSVDLWSLSYNAMLLPVVRVKQKVTYIRYIQWDMNIILTLMEHISQTNSCSLFGLKFQ